MGSDSAADEPNPPRQAQRASIELPLPVTDDTLFKYSAIPHVLNFLSDHPEIEVSIRQLARLLPVGRRSTRYAVDALIENGILKEDRTGNAKLVRIDPTRLQKPDDPILNIPQTEFHTPVRIAKRAILNEIEDVKAVILFGSVAAGRADRKSDIDLWVLVGDDPLSKRTAANELAKELGSVRIPDTVGFSKENMVNEGWSLDWLKDHIEETATHSSGSARYSFEIIVESPQSVLNQQDRVRAEELFGTGITLYHTDTLDYVIDEVLKDE